MSDPRPGFVPVPEYLTLQHNPKTWLIKDLIPLSGTALLYGLPKQGKTALAIQMACALSGGSDEWLGFQVITHGRILFLELDTPRSTFRLRFSALDRAKVDYIPENLMIADRESLSFYPFDILQPEHVKYLYSLARKANPVAVFVDTLRKVQSGDEDNSTNMSNVVSNLISAVHPASLVLISHSRKPHMDSGHDLMADHRGSGSVTGEMDAVFKMTKSRLYYGGRNIEEGNIQLERQDVSDILLWKVRSDNIDTYVAKVMIDDSLTSMRAKARALATSTGLTEEAAMSRLRRFHIPEK